ncbi:HI0074 family nucleotidyltransferase substrate-binding subunit [Streptococcus danieliae]|uniref:Nucleotidyltransferase substrate binding protein n=1 Tax=Streptococcus danieliae TaxID=747656 RepID=A0A7Z0S4A7_9STRE|nr:HI0074 family nucleotidyltransferase substrate-binding subunit [Streptococcus danieliae]MBF0698600.1 nucleotidyltransferase substrate binding protein [Streptococcus danieliae]NYS95777.1 nucleotidyltransferase substrate binding protein [Streptococcus danieliae]
MFYQERYQKKHENFSKILNHLNQNLGERRLTEFSDLELSGLLKQFTLSFDLMWKTLKDYLEFNGVDIGIISPTNVLRSAASSGLLEEMDVEGEDLIEMLRARNQLTHVYDFETALDLLERIKATYVPELLKVESFFNGK